MIEPRYIAGFEEQYRRTVLYPNAERRAAYDEILKGLTRERRAARRPSSIRGRLGGRLASVVARLAVGSGPAPAAHA